MEKKPITDLDKYDKDTNPAYIKTKKLIIFCFKEFRRFFKAIAIFIGALVFSSLK